MPISKEELEALRFETDGTLQSKLKLVRRHIQSVRELMGITEGQYLACVKEVYKDSTP